MASRGAFQLYAPTEGALGSALKAGGGVGATRPLLVIELNLLSLWVMFGKRFLTKLSDTANLSR